ncbi:MAG: replication endonuclease [Sideroxydans sp.]|nr:replication endonuclease [Sideroxydans sp.]
MTPFKDREKLSPKQISQLTTPEWVDWRLTSIHPAIRDSLLQRYIEISPLKGEYEANAWLRDKTSTVMERLSKKASQLKDNEAFEKLISIMLSDSTDLISLNKRLSDKVMKEAIRYQTIRGEDEIRSLAKPYDDNALKIRRKLRTKVKQSVSILNMSLQTVGGDSGIKHCTKFEQSLRNQQKSMWRSYGERTTLSNGEKELSMLSLMEQATSNKFAETFVMLKGLEESAKSLSMTWAMLTFTAPQHMHPNPTVGHNSWDGTTPTEANNWIHDKWHKAEARLRKKGIVLSGFRAVEPHQDGCPHWHVIVFFNEIDSDTIEQEFRKVKEWQSDIGFKFMKDNGQAKASSYAAKYVLKSMSAVNELTGEAASIETWATTWKIRRHQFFGIPNLAVWRNVRMIKECPVDPVLAPIWASATEGNASTFIKLMGGLGVKESDRPVSSRIVTTDDTKTVMFFFQDDRSQSFSFPKFFDKKLINQKPIGNKVKIEKVEVIPNYPSIRQADFASTSLQIAQLIRAERKPLLSLWNSKKATIAKNADRKGPRSSAIMDSNLRTWFCLSKPVTKLEDLPLQLRTCNGKPWIIPNISNDKTTSKHPQMCSSQSEFLGGDELELWKQRHPKAWAEWINHN